MDTDGGRFGVGLERETATPRTWWHHYSFPQEVTVYIMVSLAGLWACGYLQVWDPNPDLGSMAMVLGGRCLLEARLLTFFTPAFLPCPLSAQSFSVCSMSLFVCLQVPQAEETPVGRGWSRRMSVEGRLLALPVPPTHPPLCHQPPCLGALWTPLLIPFIQGLLKFRVPKPPLGLVDYS